MTVDTWNQDTQQLQTDLDSQQAMVAQQAADDQTYYEGTNGTNSTVDQFDDICASGDVWVAFVFFLTEVCPGMEDMLEDDLGVYGADTAVLSDYTKLFSDLQEYTTGAVPIDIPTLANRLDFMINGLNSPAVESALPESTIDIFSTQLQNMRGEIYLGNGSPYDGDLSSGDVYFNMTQPADGVTNFNSIDQMQEAAGNKDNDSATAAAAGFSDSLSVLMSTSSTASAALGQQINTVTSFLKNLLAMMSAFCKDFIDLNGSVYQNITQGEQ